MTIYNMQNRPSFFTKQLAKLFFLFIVFWIVSHHEQAFAAGNINGACANLPQTQAICTDDPCGTGVATNYATLNYNGYTSGGTCTQYCCTNTGATPTVSPAESLTPNPSITDIIPPSASPSPSITVTPTPNMQLSLTVCLHGLGNCGDNVAPNGGGNTSPMHEMRNADIGLFDSNDVLVASIAGMMKYSSASAKFLAMIPVPGTVQHGSYLVKISSDGFLTKQYPGILQITSGQTMTLPPISLVTGNINNDNQLDILDYNLLTSCFGSKQNTAGCTTPPATASAASDINDDGKVDAADYNLFLRELSVQKAN